MADTAENFHTTGSLSSAGPVPPHPVLTAHYGTAERRVGYVRQLFDDTALHYDRINTWMSMRTGERYRREALVRAGLSPGQRILDIACGTGVLARHAQDLVGPGGLVVALDPSLAMLGQAARRGVRMRGAAIAEALPLPDHCVDLVSMGYALRHVADLMVTFSEFHRVLRPGGRLLILEMVPPSSRIGRGFALLYLKYLVPGLALLATRNLRARQLMDYYWDTVDRCVPPAVVLRTLHEAGFASVRRTIKLGLMTEYTAIRPPLERQIPPRPTLQYDCTQGLLPGQSLSIQNRGHNGN